MKEGWDWYDRLAVVVPAVAAIVLVGGFFGNLVNGRWGWAVFWLGAAVVDLWMGYDSLRDIRRIRAERGQRP